MPRPKGLAKTGGRQKGTPNQSTRYIAGTAKRHGLSVIDYMVSVALDERVSEERRDKMAIAVVPYLAPRLAAIEAKVDQYNQVEMRVTRAELAAEAKRRIDEAFKEYSPPKTIDHVPPSVDVPATLPEPPPQEPESEREPVVREYARPGPLAAAPGVSRLPMRLRPPRPTGNWSG